MVFRPETDLNSYVCANALEQPNKLLIIPDLTLDPRTSTNPLVTGDPHIRFYAGAPLVTPEGHVIGSLCGIDTQPRPDGLNEAQQQGLTLLAQQVVSQLELRRAIAHRDAIRADEQRTYRARDALRDTQAALANVGEDLTARLRATLEGAMQALPAAEGGVIELIDGAELEYRVAAGSLLPQQGLRVPLDGRTSGVCARTNQPILLANANTGPCHDADMAARIHPGSAIHTPIAQGDQVLGVLKLQASNPGVFSDFDLNVAGLFANTTTAVLSAVLTAAQNRADMSANNQYWRGLFDRLSEGFIVGEAVRDVGGRIVDWRYLEVNPAFGDLIGVTPASVIGRTIREAFPQIEDEWISQFAQVVETGEAATFTRSAAVVNRWYEGRAFKLEGDRFGVLFLEVTQRVSAENRRAALLTLGDRLRDLHSIGAMTAAAAEIVGRALGATRAGFGRVEGNVEFLEIEPDWTAPGQVSIAGRHRFDDYGHIRDQLVRGEGLVINDVTTDLRTRDDPRPMQALGISALVNMPVRDKGRTVALFIVHDDKPRVWTAEELAFLRNVADRVEVGVARIQAESLQEVLNNELAHRLKNTLAIVQSIASSTLRHVTERPLVDAFERRVLALSRAHDVLMKSSWTVAKMRGVIESVLSIQADMDRFALDGPDLNLSPQATLSLSMLLHELTTNALKYGALSAQNGKVRIAWRTEDGVEPSLVLDWAESGGPPVNAPNGRSGFGSKLIRMGLLGTRQADLHYDPVGLKVEFRAPLSHIQVQVQ